jgi:hypothetical protein
VIERFFYEQRNGGRKHEAGTFTHSGRSKKKSNLLYRSDEKNAERGLKGGGRARMPGLKHKTLLVSL